MKPGRSLDKEVHQEVFGVPLVESVCENLAWVDEPRPYTRKGKRSVHVPHYSTSIEAAWEVVEKLCEHGCTVFTEYTADEEDGCALVDVDPETGEEVLHAVADTIPHAICLAALKACGVEVDDD